MNEYFKIKFLENVYLEDSFIQSIIFDGNSIIFSLDIVLTEGHELYTSPNLEEKHCYRSARLYFSSLKLVNWKKVYFKASFDSNHEIDFGNIDTFLFKEDVYILSGDWGELEVHCNSVNLELL